MRKIMAHCPSPVDSIHVYRQLHENNVSLSATVISGGKYSLCDVISIVEFRAWDFIWVSQKWQFALAPGRVFFQTRKLVHHRQVCMAKLTLPFAQVLSFSSGNSTGRHYS